MTYADRIAAVRQLIESHNATCDGKIDFDAFLKKLSELGGVTEDTLAAATWEDLQEAGLPKILAKRAAQLFRQEELQKDEPKSSGKLKNMSARELIAKLDYTDPKSAVAVRLKQLADNKRFLVIGEDGKLIEDLTLMLFSELDEFGEREYLIEKAQKFYPVYAIGEQPFKVTREHPLFPGQPLRPNGDSNNGLKWGEIPDNICHLLRFAIVDTKELRVGIGQFDQANYASEADLFLFAKNDNAWQILSIRCPKARILYERRRPEKPLMVDMASYRKNDAAKPNQPFSVPNRTH